MDNSNNNSWNPNQNVPAATPPAAPMPPVWPTSTQPTSDPMPTQPEPNPFPSQPQQTQVPTLPDISAMLTPTQDMQVPQIPVPSSQPAVSPWPTPIEPVSIPPQPEPLPQTTWSPTPQNNSVPISPVSSTPWQNPTQPEPAPITPQPFGAPAPVTFPDQSTQYVDPNTSAASSLEASSTFPIQSAPAWVPPQTLPQAHPDSTNLSDTTLPTSSEPSEQAPTDLSHLIGSSDTSNQVATQPETLVMPQTPTPDVPSIPIENKEGIPKWVIGLGVGLLIIVAGVSAYFILGIGQTPKNTSLPAQEVPVNTSPSPTATPASQGAATQTATDSSNFGELQGSGSAPQATSGATTSSTIEKLKARQQSQ